MTDDERQIAEQIERSRRRREDELMLLLLLLMADVEDDLIVAVRHGFDAQVVIANNLYKATPIIAESMADAHLDSFGRFGRIFDASGVKRSSAGDPTEIAKRYTKPADDMAGAMAVTLNNAVSRAAIEPVPDDATPNVAGKWNTPSAIVARALNAVGYDKANPYGIEQGVERNIVLASNAGFFDVANQQRETFALQHLSVIDDRTTEICLERDGLTLPADHPYWLRGISPLHGFCRSIQLPVAPPFDVSDWLPLTPPATGYGYMPLGFLNAIRPAA